MARIEGPTYTFTAGAALEPNRRVKIKAATITMPSEVEYAGAGEQHIGITEIRAVSGALVPVRLRTASGTFEGVASSSFSAGATLYGAASGKVSDTSSGTALGIALEAAAADGDIVECLQDAILSTTAATVSIADVGGFTVQTTTEAALAEIYRHIKTSQAFLPIPLTSLRELTTGAIPNAAGNGGLLASDTTPIFNTINGDTDGAMRLSWAAANSDAVGFQIALPIDLDVTAALVIRFRAAMSGATDTPVISADSYFNEGDTKVEDDSGAVTGASYAEYTISIAASDIPSNARTLSVELTPGTHATDSLYLTALWIEYQRKILIA
jgi:hypothetical protein